MPAKGSKLVEFCIRGLDKNCYLNFKWDDRSSGIFAVDFIHKRNKKWKKEYQKVYEDYYLSCKQQCTKKSDLRLRFISALRQSRFLKTLKTQDKTRRLFKICSSEHLKYLQNSSSASCKNSAFDDGLNSDGESLASPQTSEGCSSATSPFTDLSSPVSNGNLGSVKELSPSSSSEVCDTQDDMPFEQDFPMHPEVPVMNEEGSVMNALVPPTAGVEDVSKENCCTVSAVSKHTSNEYREDILSKSLGAVPESDISGENWEESLNDVFNGISDMDLKDMMDMSDDDFQSLLTGSSEEMEQKSLGVVPESDISGQNWEESLNDIFNSISDMDLKDMMGMSDDDFQSLLIGNSEEMEQKEAYDNASVVPVRSAAEPVETSSRLESTATAFDQNAALPDLIWVPEGNDPNMTVLTYYIRK